MSIDLRNDSFTASLVEKGAELKSLWSVHPATEYMWSGDPAWWSGTAPILFPFVGSLKQGVYTHEARRYSMPGHGFARTSDFSLLRRDEGAAELRLVSSPKTHQVYPFDFSLIAAYRLERDGISVEYTVENTGQEAMYFSIGSHPGFNVPFAGGMLEDYWVEFDKAERDERFFIVDNLVDWRVVEPALEQGRRIRLSNSIFDRGALVFRHPRSRSFSLRNGLNEHALTVRTGGAPYLGIWAKAGAPYVCIEPWDGIPDGPESSGILSEKEGIMSLAAGKRFSTGYRIFIR